MTKKYIYFITCSLAACISSTCLGQDNSQWRRNIAYVEAALNAPTYTINYDRIFSTGKVFTKTYHTGLAIDKSILGLSAGLHFFSGQKNHHAEFGITAIPFVENKTFVGSNIVDRDKKMNLIINAGYRYQKPGGGLFCKILAGPVLVVDPRSDNFWKMDGKVFGGISVSAGYSF